MRPDDDNLSSLRDRLHAARRLLAEASERRDVLAREIAAAADGGVPVDLVRAFGAAERAMLAAEVDMKDAEHAFALARDP